MGLDDEFHPLAQESGAILLDKRHRGDRQVSADATYIGELQDSEHASSERCAVGHMNHFFSNTGTETVNSIHGMLRSFLYQLARRLPEARKLVHSAYFVDHFRSNNVQDCVEALCDVIRYAPARVCVLIDGLDEIGDSLSDLLGLIYTLQHRTDAKVCMASRTETVLKRDLSSLDHLTVEDHNSQSITMYAKRHLRLVLCRNLATMSNYDCQNIEAYMENFEIVFPRKKQQPSLIFSFRIRRPTGYTLLSARIKLEVDRLLRIWGESGTGLRECYWTVEESRLAEYVMWPKTALSRDFWNDAQHVSLASRHCSYRSRTRNWTWDSMLSFRSHLISKRTGSRAAEVALQRDIVLEQPFINQF